MKEKYEKLKADRPGEIRNGLFLSLCRYGGNAFSFLSGVIGVSILRNGGSGKWLMEVLEEPADRFIEVGIGFLLEAVVYLIIVQLAKSQIKRNKYILELEELVETEIKTKKEENVFPFTEYQ